MFVYNSIMQKLLDQLNLNFVQNWLIIIPRSKVGLLQFLIISPFQDGSRSYDVITYGVLKVI